MLTSILVSDGVEAAWAEALELAAPGVRRVVLAPGALPRDLATIDAAYFSPDLYPARAGQFVLALQRAPRLAWLQTWNAGLDHPVFRGLGARGVRLSTGSGAAAPAIAQSVMLYLLALSRGLPRLLDAQRRRAWEPHDVQDLDGRLLAILGLGPIGLEVARLAPSFGLRVVGLRRKPRGDEPCETWSLARLDELLPLADVLVLALPLGDQTRGLIGARELALVKPGAWLVNVGRGELVDEQALAQALQDGRLGGAALDVFAREPLPASSPLWHLPNVIVTPHTAGQSAGARRRADLLFLENLGRFTRGEPLLNEQPR